MILKTWSDNFEFLFYRSNSRSTWPTRRSRSTANAVHLCLQARSQSHRTTCKQLGIRMCSQIHGPLMGPMEIYWAEMATTMPRRCGCAYTHSMKLAGRSQIDTSMIWGNTTPTVTSTTRIATNAVWFISKTTVSKTTMLILFNKFQYKRNQLFPHVITYKKWWISGIKKKIHNNINH